VQRQAGQELGAPHQCLTEVGLGGGRYKHVDDYRGKVNTPTQRHLFERQSLIYATADRAPPFPLGPQSNIGSTPKNPPPSPRRGTVPTMAFSAAVRISPHRHDWR
jgi:hypothetical protein